MISTPEGEKPEAPRPSTDSFLQHAINVMPVRVVCALTFVSFFFFWGGFNNLVKLTGRDVASLPVNFGPLVGAVAAVATPIVIWWFKRRGR